MNNRVIPIKWSIPYLDVLLVFLLTCTLFFAQVSYSNYPLLRRIQTIIVWGLLFLILISSDYHKISSIVRFDFLIIIGPYICILLLSIIQVVVTKSVTISYTIRQNSYNLYPCLLAFLLFNRYGERAVHLLWYSCIINNTYYLILFIKKYGIFGLFRVFQISELEELAHSKTLEVNEVSFVLGLLLIFFIINYKPDYKIKLIITALFVVLGTKRILFASIFVSLMAYYVFKKKSKMMHLWPIILCIIVFLWLFFVTGPYYELTAAALGINLMGRSFSGNGIFRLLLGHFSMNPFYFGHGLGYVTYVLYMNFINGVIGTNAFHNDVLKYYIDLGFIPFSIFIINMTVIISNMVKNKVSDEAAIQYLSFLTLTLISWTTDNLASYPNYMMASFLMYFLAINKKEKVDNK